MPHPSDLLLDSNLLLLFTIGLMDRDQIARFKRTRHFTLEQFDALTEIVSKTRVVVTTPHILTEVSNLGNALRDDQKSDFASALRAVIATLEERWQPARKLALHALFRFGIADVAAMTESSGAVLLTEDGRFASQVNELGGYALSLEALLAVRRQES